MIDGHWEVRVRKLLLTGVTVSVWNDENVLEAWRQSVAVRSANRRIEVQIPATSNKPGMAPRMPESPAVREAGTRGLLGQGGCQSSWKKNL